MRPLIAAVCSGLLLLVACGGDGDGGESSVESFCDFAQGQDQIFNFTDQPSPDDLEAALDRLDEAVDRAPEEIRGDIRTVADALRNISDLDPTDPSALEGFGAVLAAGQNIAAFLEAECGIEAPAADIEVPTIP